MGNQDLTQGYSEVELAGFGGEVEEEEEGEEEWGSWPQQQGRDGQPLGQIQGALVCRGRAYDGTPGEASGGKLCGGGAATERWESGAVRTGVGGAP